MRKTGLEHSAILLFIFSFCLINTISAQDANDSLTHSLRKLRFYGVPVISYTPETRTAFGIAGFATFRIGKDALHTNPSQVSIGYGYTQNKQQLAYTPFTLFTNRNWYNFYGEVGYYKYSYYYYGTGTHEVPKELYGADYPRIRISALRKWLPHYYAGLRYQYEHYSITETKPGGELALGTIPGSTGSISSGLGIVQIVDRRDTILFPTKGYWMELAAVFHTKTLGSTDNFNQFSYDFSFYKKLHRNVIWANEVYTKLLTGNAPFSQYALIGGNRKMRGYYEGRYRDKHSLILQSEFRALVYRKIGLVAFGSAGFLGGDNEYVRLNDAKISYGGGLSYIINKNDHLNLRIDYAFDNRGKGNFYFTFGEAF